MTNKKQVVDGEDEPQVGEERRVTKVNVPYQLLKRKKRFRWLPPMEVEIEASVALLLDIQLIEPVVTQNAKLDQGKDRDRLVLGPEQPMTYGKKRRRKKKK